jgi:hypothetical protein
VLKERICQASSLRCLYGCAARCADSRARRRHHTIRLKDTKDEGADMTLDWMQILSGSRGVTVIREIEPMSALIHKRLSNRNSLKVMNETFASIAVAMTVPAVALICVVIAERRSVLVEYPIAEVVPFIPPLSAESQSSESKTLKGKSAA